VPSAPQRGLPVARRWFDLSEIADGVLRVTEPYVHPYVRANAWLIRGTTGLLLVDAGCGIGALRAELDDRLDLPVTAIATHSHFDHFGGLGEFTDRAANRDDGDVIEQASDYVTLTADTFPQALLDEFVAAGAAVPDMLISAVPWDGFEVAGFRTPAVAITRWLAEGDVLDIGDRSFEVLHTPGHSPGSICLWEARSGTLMSGDVLVDGEPLLDELPRSSPTDFAASLRRLAALPIRAVYGGHGPVFGHDRARAIIADYLASRA
jgi:glyoxylase-like metal-dependent hydrolase (beta-lactamase superfamily II)